jgi:indole-3-glycerol phosphate synthase
MTLSRLRQIKESAGKPVLRKDFITDEYQIYQARAYGADAILLMANILDREQMHALSNVAFDLGMDVLFETHCAEELEQLPESAVVIGINSRNFGSGSFRLARFLRQLRWTKEDKTVNTSRFEYADRLPQKSIKVAESGVTAENCATIFSMGFQAILVGTSLLMDGRGVAEALKDFQKQIDPLKGNPTTKRAGSPAEATTA